jgi:hypothetical protein
LAIFDDMKAINIILFVTLFSSISFAQLKKMHRDSFKGESYFETKKITNFELDYEVFSFFPTPRKYYPLVWIKDDSLQVTYTQITSSYSTQRYDNMNYIDTIWVYDTLTKYVKFRQGSIDSITQVIKHMNRAKYLNDTQVFVNNWAIIDGAINYMDIIYDKSHKLTFELGNTFDSTALQIVNIINPYLPFKKKIYVPYDLWKDQIEFDKRHDSINK